MDIGKIIRNFDETLIAEYKRNCDSDKFDILCRKNKFNIREIVQINTQKYSDVLLNGQLNVNSSLLLHF